NQARAQAAHAFREWLLSDTGQATLSASGLHPVKNVPPDKDSPLTKPNSHVPANAPTWDNRSPTNVDETMSLYGRAHTAGRVVFLVDVSWSMSNNGNMALAKTIVNTALGVMGPQDQVGLTTVPKTTGASDELNELVPPYVENTRDKVAAALGGVVPIHNGAALFDAMNVQLGQMNKDAGPLKQTLVVITDGEDKGDNGVNPLSKQSIDTLLGSYGGGQLTVEVVALPPTACSDGLDRL
ncbi:VWA domain-containing protein, partial [Kibdelosporangium lantanae]